MPYQDRDNYSEQTIQRILYSYFKDMHYKIANVYMFGAKNTWETDFFFVAKNKHLWDIEIKVDRQDFDRDFQLKPKKHRIFKEVFETGDRKNILLPNSYYFCAPEGVIPHDRIPEYAGLIEVFDKNKVRYVGGHPKIHTDVQEVDAILLKKFYNKSLKLENLLADFRIKIFENPDDKEEILKKFLKTIRM